MNLDQQIMRVGLLAHTEQNPDMKALYESTVETLKQHRTVLQGVAILRTGAMVYQATMEPISMKEVKK